MDTRLPVILLTGFLGAGKTTLLLRWLRESPMTGLRMGVVMNEFGAESVDSQLIDRPGLPLRQVAGGCVCCAPDSELDRACTQLATSGTCDYLVLETSGLADPDNVIDILTDPDLLDMVRLQAVVTVVDAQWYADARTDAGERVLAKRQLEFAHIIALSRCDRITEEDRIRVESDMRVLNPRARLVRLPFALPEIGEILRGEPAACEMAPAEPLSGDTSPHLHTRYQSLTFHFPVAVDRSKFEAFLSGLDGREVVRAKGFIRFLHAPQKLFVFQSVWGHHVIDEFPAQPQPAPVAVLIGPDLQIARHQAALRNLCFGKPANSLTLAPAPTA